MPGPKGRPVPPVALMAVSGMPKSRLPEFTNRLTDIGGQYDIAIVEGAFDDGTLSLKGSMKAAPSASTVTLTYSWTLTDKDGAVLHQFAGSEPGASAGGADAWAAITPAVLDRAASKTIKSIAARLSELGYATQTATLLLPGDALRTATKKDAKKIDYETVNGPDASGDMLTTASVDPAPPPVARGGLEIPPDLPPPPSVARKKKKEGAQEIKAVAVVPVKGAPGKGNEELTAAMRKTLAEAGWPVLKAPRADALTISGIVKLAPPAKGQQQVALAWAVTTPDGRPLGTITQANSVEAGSLNGSWGEAAGYVAEGAASGIYDLINKHR